MVTHFPLTVYVETARLTTTTTITVATAAATTTAQSWQVRVQAFKRKPNLKNHK